MAQSSADQRRVFLAYRTVFSEANAQLRKAKKVREVVEQHRHSFEPLMKDFGVEKITEIIHQLLKALIFESELKSKIAFPELYQTSPSRDVTRAAS